MLVRLICWKEDLAAERSAMLKTAGFQVDASAPHTSGIVGQIRDLAPHVVLIDLDRAPSQFFALNALRTSVIEQGANLCAQLVKGERLADHMDARV